MIIGRATRFTRESLIENSRLDSGPIPPNLSDDLVCLVTPVVFDTPKWDHRFGDCISQPPERVESGMTVTAKFSGLEQTDEDPEKIVVYWKERRLFSNLYVERVKIRIGEEMSEVAAHPRNNLTHGFTYLTVERYDDASRRWTIVATDANWETSLDMYNDDQVFNTDECGFHKEMPFGRTLECQRTSKVYGVVQSKVATTHFYTITPVVSKAGKLMLNNDSTALVYCMNGHRYDERFVRRIINKSGCVRVACWGWMSYDGAGHLERIHGQFTAEVYEHILANVMIPSSRKRYPEGTLFFQQDNHPIHTANRIQRLFTRRRDVDSVDWPPNSPDMNPIQNLWGAVKRILRSNWAEQPPVRTPEELWDRVLDAWEEMAKNLDLFHNLVDSMPRRMRAVVDAGGMGTRY
ncbi:hypothetical protein ANN_14247 [Periplaneta americana]|uniref:Uncharacterized protein n=1 Tax=Periplaneta americana TaxID=6978 RepID=A0ABQ8SWD1_PERAM|nr:hypothetical protein ANN_14247 [Periplaneta americana]